MARLGRRPETRNPLRVPRLQGGMHRARCDVNANSLGKAMLNRLRQRAVEILGDGPEARTRIDMLEKVFHRDSSTDDHYGSFMKAREQLLELMAAAESMALVIRELNGAAKDALRYWGDMGRKDSWKSNAGEAVLAELDQVKERMNLPFDVVAETSPQGSLIWRYREEELLSLAKFCRREGKHLEQQHSENKGLPSASRVKEGSPKTQLVDGCARAIREINGNIDDLNELVWIIASLKAAEKVPKRFAERECQKAKKSHRPPP